MTLKERKKVQTLIRIAMDNNPHCAKCESKNWCPFAYECLTKNYKFFKKNVDK